MNAEKIVEALRDGYEETDAVYFFARTIFRDAADLIESQAAYIARLNTLLTASQRRERAAVELIAKLVLLCEPPKEWRDKVFRRLHVGAGDYMGSGYAFLDAFHRIWDGFIETADDDLCRTIRDEIEKQNVARGPQEAGKGESNDQTL